MGGMTIAGKILAAKGGRDVERPGDIVTVDVDTVILFDNNFMPVNWRDILKIRDPERSSAASSRKPSRPRMRSCRSQASMAPTQR